MWTQHNKDCHGCNNHTSAIAVERTDNQVQALYNKIVTVLPYKREKYYT